MTNALAQWAAALNIFDGIKHHFEIPGLESTAEDRIAERRHMAMLLSLKASCHAKAAIEQMA